MLRKAQHIILPMITPSLRSVVCVTHYHYSRSGTTVPSLNSDQTHPSLSLRIVWSYIHPMIHSRYARMRVYTYFFATLIVGISPSKKTCIFAPLIQDRAHRRATLRTYTRIYARLFQILQNGKNSKKPKTCLYTSKTKKSTSCFWGPLTRTSEHVEKQEPRWSKKCVLETLTRSWEAQKCYFQLRPKMEMQV